MEKIALIRPGAIGDIMMALNFVQELKSKKEVTFFCSSGIHSILNNFISNNNLVNFQPLEKYKKENFDKTINH
jgi:ADP-heptose:LPS heptosyltransferase